MILHKKDIISTKKKELFVKLGDKTSGGTTTPLWNNKMAWGLVSLSLISLEPKVGKHLF